jgi:methionyl-tRNA synthetase
LGGFLVSGKRGYYRLLCPAILLGAGGLHLPDRIISSEYLTLEGQKFSTSRNWAVWVPDILERYHPDSIRYFLIANGPEKRDTDFSWREFIYSHNGELLGAFGNFVNRSLAFVEKFYEGKVPDGKFAQEWGDHIDLLYLESGRLIESGDLKDALDFIFFYVRKANQYFDWQKPWLQVKEDRDACDSTIFTCVQIIANLANLLQPFLPFSCEKIRGFLALELPNWQVCSVPPFQQVTNLQLLFERIDISRIKEEEDRLVQQQVNS